MYQNYIATFDRMTKKLWIENHLEENGRGLMKVISQHTTKGTEETQDSEWSAQSKFKWSIFIIEVYSIMFS